LKVLTRGFLKIVFLICFMVPFALHASEEKPDISETLFRHILNGVELDLFPGLPPVILPFGMSVHQFMIGLGVFLILSVFIFGVRKKTLKPRGIAILIEAAVLFVRDDIVYPIMGEERGEKWLSFFLSLFVFLFTVNIIGLVPALKTATGNINVTGAMAGLVFVLTFLVGFKELGLSGFFKNMYPEGVNPFIGVFVVLLEFIGIFTKSIVLSLRLFANMFAGHLAILSFLVLIFVVSPFFSFVSVPFAVFTYLLEVLVAFLQAFVFTLLSCIFIMMASTPEGEQ